MKSQLGKSVPICFGEFMTKIQGCNECGFLMDCFEEWKVKFDRDPTFTYCNLKVKGVCETCV